MTARFLAPVVLEVGETDESPWTLWQGFGFNSEVLGCVVDILAGFKTDLASVKRIPGLYTLFGGTANKAAIVHDHLYTEQPCTRKQADDVFYEACLVSGVPRWRAWSMWAGIRIGGASHWDKRTKS